MKKQYLLLNSKIVLFLSILLLSSSANAHIDTVMVGPNGTFTFSPSNFTMNMGDTVRWVWESGSHTTTSSSIPVNAVSWDSPMTSSVQTFTYVPSELGTYNYVCTPHSGSMKGSFSVICNVDTSVYRSNDTLMSNADNVDYQWVDCNNNYLGLAKDSNKVFVPIINGTYAVIITQNACIDTSMCYNVTNVGIGENNSMLPVDVFPNPSNGLFIINNDKQINNADIIVFNSIGVRVYQKLGFNGTTLKIDLTEESKGVYFIEIRENNKTYSSKLIVK